WKRVLRGEIAPQKNAEGDGKALPAMRRGDPARVASCEVEEKRTKPPGRHTEGTLIQAMKNVGRLVEEPRFKQILRETSGIGTEATRAAIIDNLLQRRLLVREGKTHLLSTPVGRTLVDALPLSVTNPATTAIWEQALEDIANGTRTLEAFQEKAVVWVTRLVGAIREGGDARIRHFSGLRPEETPDRERPDGVRCPACKQGTLLERRAGTGRQAGHPFLGCSRFPRCRFTRPV
ncbi:MAG: topoisomerase DNA-binding C4 zinc finger domain-containing protein, partial [Magnetococcales bacterium]|nr:topoisomerase DNA-binding C4 zinc finger domain-containing protein [Magnetococcales bacterium]